MDLAMSETLRMNRQQIAAAFCALLLLAGIVPAAAQAPAESKNYPSHALRYIVPYPPGGFNDTLGRVVSQKLQDRWGHPVVVENRPGGGTLIGSDAVANAAPDGYTLLGG